MSQENVERFREAVEAINAGDIETALNVMHPDVEWRTLDMFPDAGTYHGPEGTPSRVFSCTWRTARRWARIAYLPDSALVE